MTSPYTSRRLSTYARAALSVLHKGGKFCQIGNDDIILLDKDNKIVGGCGENSLRELKEDGFVFHITDDGMSSYWEL